MSINFLDKDGLLTLKRMIMSALPAKRLNRADYDLLTEEQKMSGRIYRIEDEDATDYSGGGPDFTEIRERLDVVEEDVSEVQGRLDTAEGDISEVQGRLDTAEGNVDTLSDGLSALDSKVEECFQSVSDGKALVASAITDKGTPTSSDATFEDLANSVSKIQTGNPYLRYDASTKQIQALNEKNAWVPVYSTASLPLGVPVNLLTDTSIGWAGISNSYKNTSAIHAETNYGFSETAYVYTTTPKELFTQTMRYLRLTGYIQIHGRDYSDTFGATRYGYVYVQIATNGSNWINVWSSTIVGNTGLWTASSNFDIYLDMYNYTSYRYIRFVSVEGSGVGNAIVIHVTSAYTTDVR